VRIVTFEDQNGRRVGVLDGDAVADVAAVDDELPTDIVDLVALGSSGLKRLRNAVDRAPRLPSESLRLLAPIPRPRKNVMAVGRNYRDHAQEFTESGFDASEKQMIPDHPVVFTKAPTSVIGPEVPIDTSNDPLGTTDYEGELAFVIGTPAKSVSRERAMEHVYGYTIINDVTARDLQKRHVQWFIGKSPDTFCPMGPCITTIDELPDIGASWLRTWVNGELRQEAPISALIFDIPTLIAVLSEVMTLEPGDVVATGTGLGVGIGFNPPRYLQPGDRVEIAIDGIGRLGNPVV
jgi:2-keto-4-pentenoate hydratase/2-oxohepta-3-ene-1,7-dioic acid hydratase in catechol pathway